MSEKYILTLQVSLPDKPVAMLEKIEGASLIELCSKFPLLVSQLAMKVADQKVKTEVEKIRKMYNDDDIPF